MIRKFFFFYIICDLILIAFSLYMGGLWLLNTQIAFICSMLILFSSFYGYKKMVHVKSSLFKDEDFDEEIEDKEIIKKTRKTVGIFKYNFSPFRLLSYGLLILAFLYLNRHNWLEITPFFLGLGVLPIGSLLIGFKKVYGQ